MEFQLKCKQEHVHIVVCPVKNPNTFESQSRGQQGRSHYRKYRKPHVWVCRVGGLGCYNCGKTGDFSRDCTQVSSLICFHCNQAKHMKVDYPRLSRGVVTTPIPTTLRITNGRQGKVEVPVVRIRKAEDA